MEWEIVVPYKISWNKSQAGGSGGGGGCLYQKAYRKLSLKHTCDVSLHKDLPSLSRFKTYILLKEQK